MKKNFFGLAAIIAAIVFSAFTVKPTATQSFFFDSTANSLTKTNVENEDLWQVGSTTCTTGARAACAIVNVDEKFYHTDGGEIVLNSANRPSSDPNDVEYSITAVQGNTSGIFLVSSVPTLGGTIDNKQ